MGETGDELGWEQWKLPVQRHPRPRTYAATARVAATVGELIRFSGPEFARIFDRVHGTDRELQFRGVPLLDRGPLPDFWRAVTDNDWGAWQITWRQRRAKNPASTSPSGGRRPRRGR